MSLSEKMAWEDEEFSHLWTEDPNYLSNKEVHLIFYEDVNLILEFLLCLLLAKTWAMGASIRVFF